MSAYRQGCRCPAARNAHRLYNKRRREGRPERHRIPAIGTVRRIEALWAIGHTAADIGVAAGFSTVHVTTTARARTWVSPATAAAYQRAYDALSMQPGTSRRNRNLARSRGWAPPLAWDEATIEDPRARPKFGHGRDSGPDHAVVARVLNNSPVEIRSDADRRAAVIALGASGVDEEVIAQRLGITVDGVRQALYRARRSAGA